METTQSRVVSLQSADNDHPRVMAEASQRFATVQKI
jgi:hypothetical protein